MNINKLKKKYGFTAKDIRGEIAKNIIDYKK